MFHSNAHFALSQSSRDYLPEIEQSLVKFLSLSGSLYGRMI